MRKTAVLLALMAMSMSDVFAATGKVVTTNYVDGALKSLDAAQVGANGSYIQYVSETDGIVSATAKAFDTSMSSSSTNAVQNKVVNTALGKKQNKLSTAQLDAVNSGITATKLAELEAKQGALTDAQLNAVNSGITAAKVSTYDGYASGKQATLAPGTNIKGSGSVTVTKGTDGVITVSGTDTNTTYTAGTNITITNGVISAKDTVYTLPTASSSTLGGVKVDTALSSSSTNPVQNKAVNAAISNLQTAVGGKQDTLVPDTNIKGSGSVTVTKGTDGVITVSGTDTNTTYTAGTNITITNGVISAKDTVYTLPTASSSTLGGVKVDTALSSSSTNPVQNKAVYSALSGKLSTTGTAAKATADASGNNIVNTYATKTALSEGLAAKQETLAPGTNIKGSGSVTVTKGTDGVITVSGTDNNTTYTAGTNITITDGVISAKDTVYTLPTATSSRLGGVKVDTALSSTSTNPVQNKAVNTAISNLQTAVDGKQATLAPGTNIKGSGSVTVTKGTDGVITVTGTDNNTTYTAGTNITISNGVISAKDTVYTLPTASADTLGGVKVDTALSSTSINPVQNKAVNTAISNLQTAVDGKQATLTTTNVTTSGSGNVVTAVTASNGTVTVTKGTTLGSLATKSAVGSSDITDGGVALADLASNSVNSAKIVDGSVATADIANGAVTAVKTTGIFGFIPSGSEGASTTATIWVE